MANEAYNFLFVYNSDHSSTSFGFKHADDVNLHS